jgi:hypothetical protein
LRVVWTKRKRLERWTEALNEMGVLGKLATGDADVGSRAAASLLESCI